MLLSRKRVLVLAPHTDDGEFGCGATIARLTELDAEVYYVAFSDCRDSVPAGWPTDVLVTEVAAASRVLGIPPKRLQVHSFPVRRFCEHRQEILDVMVGLARNFQPELVLAPSLVDLHQDHEVVAREALRAFKSRTILGYELPWNNLQFQHQVFVAVADRHLCTKIAAVKCYKSQADRHYASEASIRAQAIMRGVQVAVPLAEVFELVRAVVR